MVVVIVVIVIVGREMQSFDLFFRESAAYKNVPLLVDLSDSMSTVESWPNSTNQPTKQRFKLLNTGRGDDATTSLLDYL